jgi:hypothetical protein
LLCQFKVIIGRKNISIFQVLIIYNLLLLYYYRSAVEFILNIDSTSLSIDPEEFTQKLEEAERLYDSGTK